MEQKGRHPWRQRRPIAYAVGFLLLLLCNVSAQIRYSITEEVKKETVVGNIAKDLGLDTNSLKE
uniref:Cadherin N-terminal domain-containing protein n=1 Tax=Gadus morhua TaxID=8049 RepID=A0A8C5BSC8_GADMO